MACIVSGWKWSYHQANEGSASVPKFPSEAQESVHKRPSRTSVSSQLVIFLKLIEPVCNLPERVKTMVLSRLSASDLTSEIHL